MDETAFIKCPSCLSEVEVSRSSFYRLAGRAIRCPECSAPIPVPLQATWEEFIKGEAPVDAAEMQEKMAAEFHDTGEEQDPASPPAASPGPAAGKTAAPPTFAQPAKRMNKGVVFAAVALVCIVATWVCIHLSADKPSPPPVATPAPAATTTTTTTIPPAAAPLHPVVPVAPEPDRVADAAALFAAYKEAFLKGDMDGARAALKDLKSSFVSAAAREEFWQKNIPAGKRRTLRLMVLCAACVEQMG